MKRKFITPTVNVSKIEPQNVLAGSTVEVVHASVGHDVKEGAAL